MMAITLNVHQTLHIRNIHIWGCWVVGGEGAAVNFLKSLKALISSCPTNYSTSLLSITGEWISLSGECGLTTHKVEDVPRSVLGLWATRRASINIGSIILSSEVSDGLHVRGRRPSTILSTSVAKYGGASTPSEKWLQREIGGCLELHLSEVWPKWWHRRHLVGSR
jgi:hypothetical protein